MSVGNALNVAVTDLLASTVTVQVPEPLHAPPHPAKFVLAPGFAISVTDVPALKEAVHVDPQLIPAGVLVTVPEPVFWTVRLND